ncbi:hypothetical protein HMI56_004346, partial [Coelomomyces lativittatus]
SHILLFWRNNKCIVIGRNQNPWTECNVRKVRLDHVPLVRRKSGGGTVYHDLGNSIYSMIQPKSAFHRTKNAHLIAQALHTFDLPVEVNARHDLLLNQCKVSGSAFKLTRDRAYHHGTLLIQADLHALRNYLSPPSLASSMLTNNHAVPSVPSPVTCLSHPALHHDSFCHAVLKQFQLYHGCLQVKPIEIDESILTTEPMVKEIYEELNDLNWIYGQTPEFTFQSACRDFSFRLQSKQGRIMELQIQFSNDFTNALASLFQSFLPHIIGAFIFFFLSKFVFTITPKIIRF